MLEPEPVQVLCRDCTALTIPKSPVRRCPSCGARHLVRHYELDSLSFAHLDCDAFYASVEKRDRPELRDKPVIVGGGQRGVVSAACYVARLYGVRSAMPMFKALSLCPDAVVLKPDMNKYREVSRGIRDRMSALTPQIEPLSLDEAFLDLAGTSRLHHAAPAQSLARLANEIERDLGISVSIGLSTCKLLAKIASDLDKPRGFAVIGESEAAEFLSAKPVSILWGVGGALQKKLLSDGIRLVQDLLSYEESELMARYGAMGRRLYLFARGQDPRPVEADAPAKSLSSETTFEQDIQELDCLRRHLWPLCEKVARRLRDKEVAGKTVTLKLRLADFRLQTRSRQLFAPTQSADTLYETGGKLLEENWKDGGYRLIGIGAGDLVRGELADPPDFLDPQRTRRIAVEKAVDGLNQKLGTAAVRKGRSFHS